jgi:ATP-dependent DNA ligase
MRFSRSLRFGMSFSALAPVRTACGHHDGSVFLYAFDLLELNGDDLRRDPLEVRKATLASVLARASPGIRLNEHIEHEDGPAITEPEQSALLSKAARLSPPGRPL